VWRNQSLRSPVSWVALNCVKMWAAFLQSAISHLTGTTQSQGNEHRKRWVFRWLQKTDRDSVDGSVNQIFVHGMLPLHQAVTYIVTVPFAACTFLTVCCQSAISVIMSDVTSVHLMYQLCHHSDAVVLGACLSAADCHSALQWEQR